MIWHINHMNIILASAKSIFMHNEDCRFIFFLWLFIAFSHVVWYEYRAHNMKGIVIQSVCVFMWSMYSCGVYIILHMKQKYWQDVSISVQGFYITKIKQQTNTGLQILSPICNIKPWLLHCTWHVYEDRVFKNLNLSFKQLRRTNLFYCFLLSLWFRTMPFSLSSHISPAAFSHLTF